MINDCLDWMQAVIDDIAEADRRCSIIMSQGFVRLKL